MNPIRIALERELDELFMQTLFELAQTGIAYWCHYADIDEPIQYYDDAQTCIVSLTVTESEQRVDKGAPKGLQTHKIDAALLNLGIERLLTGDLEETNISRHVIENVFFAIHQNSASELDGDDVDAIVQAGLYNNIIWG